MHAYLYRTYGAFGRPFVFAVSSWHNVSLRLKVGLFFYKSDIRGLFY